jgi:hypothetical protein
MKTNEGGFDRVIRIVGSVVLAGAAYATTGAVRTVLIVLAVIALFTGLTGFCLLYRLFGISTNKEPK